MGAVAQAYRVSVCNGEIRSTLWSRRWNIRHGTLSAWRPDIADADAEKAADLADEEDAPDYNGEAASPSTGNRSKGIAQRTVLSG
ncbi:hypothetical protein [Rhizobium leguminosarum]|uniref:hypothetical protein n=1 Tax=Rhizobium leguminosarum TaxID=384 RepID=UPI0013EEDD64|nr:hypothetical protein [Rhizobium leguminosarum]